MDKSNIDSTLFRENLKEYLDSKLCAGGLYGLTVKNDEFVDGLIETIKLGIENKKFINPIVSTDDFDWCDVNY